LSLLLALSLGESSWAISLVLRLSKGSWSSLLLSKAHLLLWKLSSLSWLFFIFVISTLLLIVIVVLVGIIVVTIIIVSLVLVLIFSIIVLIIVIFIIIFVKLDESVSVRWCPGSVHVSVNNVLWHVSSPFFISDTVVDSRSSSLERKLSESLVVVISLGVPCFLSLDSAKVLLVPSLLVGKGSFDSPFGKSIDDVLVDLFSCLDLLLDLLGESLLELFFGWFRCLSSLDDVGFLSNPLVSELVEGIRSLSGVVSLELLNRVLTSDGSSVVLDFLNSLDESCLGNAFSVVWNLFGLLGKDNSLDVVISQSSQQSCYDYLLHFNEILLTIFIL